MEFKNSQTYKNLKTALAGESEAKTRYEFYASRARKDGYIDFAQKIEAIAHNEKEHAKIWFKFLHEEEVPSTAENLKEAIAGENYEHTTMYKQFAQEAREEGFNKIACLFDSVGKIEEGHEAMYKDMLMRITEKKVFQQDQPACWVCLECGFVYIGEKAPALCPVCGHGQEFFSRRDA